MFLLQRWDAVDVFEDKLEDEPEDSEDLEDEKSGSESSDEESIYDELEEFQNSNANCTSGSVEFIDNSNEPPIELCPADSDTSEDRERGTEDEDQQ